jgi:2-polyprenyl-6-methoxyphenol hydroxylase-like FAD-dependent oxidoreductase
MASSSPIQDTEVLVVGAGPTGLMLANQLARHGVTPLIIDRHSGPAQQSRAMAVHARTLEIYSKLGVADNAIAKGAIGTAANMWTNNRLSARIPLGEIGKGKSPYPFVLMLGQDENERILGDKLKTLGVDVHWNTELIALSQQPGNVEATLKLPDGKTKTIKVKWVGGCDGSRSIVRESNRITFPGAAYEHVFFVADTEATGSMIAGELNVFLLPDGFHLFFPMKGRNRWRVIGILPEKLRNRNDLTFEEVVPALRQEAGANLTFHECAWFSTYRIYHRAASRFRDRRCFLLGDAAHIHSPMGAQGMNTGLQDAYNLAWKLAFVSKGLAAEKLLDSYEEERLPVARRLLETTDRAFQLVVSDSWLASLFRTRIMARIAARAMTIDGARDLAFRTISQIGIKYPHSQLSQTLPGLPRTAPRAGDRFPWLHLKPSGRSTIVDLFEELGDTCFNLLVFGQPPFAKENIERNGLLKVHVISDDDVNDAELNRAAIDRRSTYLVRPDGHIGLCGVDLGMDAVHSYLKQRVHLKGFGPVTPPA